MPFGHIHIHKHQNYHNHYQNLIPSPLGPPRKRFSLKVSEISQHSIAYITFHNLEICSPCVYMPPSQLRRYHIMIETNTHIKYRRSDSNCSLPIRTAIWMSSAKMRDISFKSKQISCTKSSYEVHMNPCGVLWGWWKTVSPIDFLSERIMWSLNDPEHK